MRSNLLDDVIVDVDTPADIQLWTTEFGISLPLLEDAIARVGHRFNDLRQELGLARLYFFPRDDCVNQRFLLRGLALS